jgi:cytochrome c-type biogenesis protein
MIFSLQLIGLINISYLNFEKRFEAKKSKNILFPYLIGLAFGFGWTPCIGPILGSILALASIEETLSKAIILLTFYSVGLAIPFVLSGYLIQRFLVFSKNFKKNINLISKIGGTILLITGILILTNQLQTIGFYIIKIFPFMQNFG